MIEAQLSLPNNTWIYWFILRVDGLSDALVLSIVWQHSEYIFSCRKFVWAAIWPLEGLEMANKICNSLSLSPHDYLLHPGLGTGEQWRWRGELKKISL